MFKIENQDEVLKMHSGISPGVLSIKPRFEVKDAKQLSKVYTPGVAKIAKLIEKNPIEKNKYTISGKLIAVVTDGTAVLGLGDIGQAGGLPIVEGKALLYKALAGVDAIPLALNQVSVDELVETLKNISTSFAGFHLEDIKAPRCFELEEKLVNELDIPIYHDDQDGTAIIVLAALINACKVASKNLTDLKVIINGVGASGYATAKLLLAAGVKKLTLIDKNGQITADNSNYNKYQRELANESSICENYQNLSQAICDQDVFIGLSVGDVLKQEDVVKMATNPIIFALANPKPEIDPKVAKEAGAKIIATGSSEYPNQVNNVLVFPGLYKGLLKSGLKRVTLDLEIAIAKGISSMVKNPTAEKFIPGVFDEEVVDKIVETIENFAEK